MENEAILYDNITTTITLNIWGLFRRSGKKKICLEYDNKNLEDEYLLNLVFATRSLGAYTKVYLKMPLMDYIRFRIANRKFRKTYALSLFNRNKYIIEKERLLNDARIAYGVDDVDIYKKICNEFFRKEEENV